MSNTRISGQELESLPQTVALTSRNSSYWHLQLTRKARQTKECRGSNEPFPYSVAQRTLLGHCKHRNTNKGVLIPPSLPLPTGKASCKRFAGLAGDVEKIDLAWPPGNSADKTTKAAGTALTALIPAKALGPEQK
jgi:hypothetical protein